MQDDDTVGVQKVSIKLHNLLNNGKH